MAVKAKVQITLSAVVDVDATYRYYKLQASNLAAPTAPTTTPKNVPSGWTKSEPSYTEGSTNSLYFVDGTLYSDGTFGYSAVSLSSSYEAAKSAYNKAVAATNTANKKAQVYYQASAPSGTAHNVNDIWFDTDGGNQMYYWNGSAWTAKQFGAVAIADGAITAEKLSVGTISAITANLGTVTAGIIQSPNFKMSDYTVDEFGEVSGTIGSGVKIDLTEKAFYTPQITIKDNYINVIGYGSFGTRVSTSVIGEFSFTNGVINIASGFASHAEGAETTANAHCAHAEGGLTKATGIYAHAEGWGGNASGQGAHAEGLLTLATGYYAHAEGRNVVASGTGAHAEGEYTLASSENQHVQGKYNIEDASGVYAHIVGNGTSSSKRANAYTLDWSGNGWYAGDVIVGGTQSAGGTVTGGISLKNHTHAWDSITGKPNTFTPASHTHSYLPLSGGNLTGHVYLTGSNASSSTGNTSQLVFGTSSNNHVVLSANDKALIINPTTSTTTNQIVLYLNQASVFPSGISANVTGNLTGNASTATKLATARTISLTGSVTGSGTFDGSGNLTINTTTNHTHSYLPLAGGTITGTVTFNASPVAAYNAFYNGKDSAGTTACLIGTGSGGIYLGSSNYPTAQKTVIVSSGHTFRPDSNGSQTLGTSSYKWSNVYATTFTGTLSGNATTATTATKLGSSTLGSATNPIYLSSGTATECSKYAGGTAVTLNGSSKAASTASFYAPTGAGASGNILVSNGSGAPSWAATSGATGTRTGLIKIGKFVIEFGSVSVSTGSSASNSLYNGSAAITFSSAYIYAPAVLTSWSGRYTDMHSCGSSGLSTTGATIWAQTTAASVSRNVQWIAIGCVA